MPNLMTAPGELIPSGGNIAGAPSAPLGVSSLMSYGSFSGTDIKVVVNYPRDRMLERVAAEAKIKKENDLSDAKSSFVSRFSVLTPQQVQQEQNNITFMEEELASIDNTVLKGKDLPATKTLDYLQTLSWGVFREKAPVRTLGSVYPRGYTRGNRTISGTMIFTVFLEHVFYDLMLLNLRHYNTGTSDYDRFTYTTQLPDQLPPLDLTIFFANEYGATSQMGLYGVEFFQDGGTFSIEDLYSEESIQYVARDIDPMRPVETRAIDGQGVTSSWTKTASQMLNEELLFGPAGTVQRRNPFI
jgi:hypothetical protein